MSIVKGKQFFEQYARLSLIGLCDFDADNYVCLDKPDIHSIDRSLGIEVTSDVYEDEQEMTRVAENIWHTPYSELSEKKLHRVLKECIISETNDRITRISLKSGAIENKPEHLIETVLKKQLLLNAGEYEKFDHYHLYVYTDTIILDGYESYIGSVINTLVNNRGAKNYSILYLNQWYVLYVCNIEKETYEKIPISTVIRKKLCMEARRLCPD